jgi:hypothetical protein
MRRALEVFIGISIVALAWVGVLRLGGIDMPLHVQLLGGVFAGVMVEGIKAFGPRPRKPM